MLIGYARVSKDNQDTAAQVAALKAAGCERIFREKTSGGRWDRPQLQRLLDQLRSDDIVVVWKLDRLSRSLRDVLTIMEQLEKSGAGFRSLTEAIDTTTPAGRMMMQMVGAFAENGPYFASAPRLGWTLPDKKVESADVASSSHRSSRMRFERWFPKVARRRPMLHDCSKSIPLPSRGCWRGQEQRPLRASRAPNSVQSLTPDNLQSDSWPLSLDRSFRDRSSIMIPTQGHTKRHE